MKLADRPGPAEVGNAAGLQRSAQEVLVPRLVVICALDRGVGIGKVHIGLEIKAAGLRTALLRSSPPQW